MHRNHTNSCEIETISLRGWYESVGVHCTPREYSKCVHICKFVILDLIYGMVSRENIWLRQTSCAKLLWFSDWPVTIHEPEKAKRKHRRQRERANSMIFSQMGLLHGTAMYCVDQNRTICSITVWPRTNYAESGKYGCDSESSLAAKDESHFIFSS